MEWISNEHTGKNLMVVGTRRPGHLSEGELSRLQKRRRELQGFYGIQRQHLIGLLSAGEE